MYNQAIKVHVLCIILQSLVCPITICEQEEMLSKSVRILDKCVYMTEYLHILFFSQSLFTIEHNWQSSPGIRAPVYSFYHCFTNIYIPFALEKIMSGIFFALTTITN